MLHRGLGGAMDEGPTRRSARASQLGSRRSRGGGGVILRTRRRAGQKLFGVQGTRRGGEMSEHPDDIAAEKQAKAEAAQYGDALVNERIPDLRRLITTYSDGDAQELLENIREWFWASALPDVVE